MRTEYMSSSVNTAPTKSYTTKVVTLVDVHSNNVHHLSNIKRASSSAFDKEDTGASESSVLRLPGNNVIPLYAYSGLPKTNRLKYTRYMDGDVAKIQVATNVKDGADETFIGAQNDLQKQVVTWLAGQLGTEKFLLEMSFSELGIKSIEVVSLINILQDFIGRTVLVQELLGYSTMSALIERFSKQNQRSVPNCMHRDAKKPEMGLYQALFFG